MKTNWENNELVFIQSKTRNILSLPLTQDVGWAVIDYLKYGRPKVENSYVFIRHVAPFLPFSEDDHLSQIIAKYMRLAHIPISSKRKVGMHSLRHYVELDIMGKTIDFSFIYMCSMFKHSP